MSDVDTSVTNRLWYLLVPAVGLVKIVCFFCGKEETNVNLPGIMGVVKPRTLGSPGSMVKSSVDIIMKRSI